MDIFLSPEWVSPPSLAEEPQGINNDTNEEVLVFDSNTEKVIGMNLSTRS